MRCRSLPLAVLCLAAVALLFLNGCAGFRVEPELASFPDYTARCVDGFKTKDSNPDKACIPHGGVEQKYLATSQTPPL